MITSRGQSTLEYAVFVCVVVATLIAMATYMKRGFQGHLRGVAGKITTEPAYSYDKFKLRPDIMLDKFTPGIQEDEQKLAGTKGSGNDYAYSPGATASYSTIETDIEETAESLGTTIKTTNITSKMTNRSEDILPYAQEPARW